MSETNRPPPSTKALLLAGLDKRIALRQAAGLPVDHILRLRHTVAETMDEPEGRKVLMH